MVYYFTGTGNSKFIAEAFAERLETETVCLNDYIKKKEVLVVENDRRIVFVAPIYAWRYPVIVENLIKNALYKDNNHVYFIGTMQSQTGNCAKYCQRLCKEAGLEFRGFSGIPMPNNYIVSGDVPNEREVFTSLKMAIPVVDTLAYMIKQDMDIKKNDFTPFSGLLSGAVNKMFNKYMTSSDGFNVSSDCISCGLCQKECPVNNILLKNGKPEFGQNCINCLRCIHGCPKKAINIKDKTQNRGRYMCPEYKEFIKLLGD
ncbi:MAG: EFR1 family ferrodoxin [Lachnospiraceae bacterium]|nr:EFR1 family ferrodoxin [Lachnospiraceae bacterium]